MPNGDAKRDAILDAAAEVFAKYGFRKTTVGDVIREAGVSRATVYKHFDDKTDIFEAVITREIRELLAADREAVRNQSSTRARLRVGIMTHTDGIRRKINVMRLMREAFAEITPHHGDRMQELTQEGIALFRDIIARGVEEGEIVADDLDAAAVTLMYAVKGIFIGAVTGVWDERREEILDNMLDMIMDGLRPREETES